MRLFGSERISKVMDRMGFKEGEMIEHSMISKSIERAQKKVEENNFGIRKRLLEYDDVMNSQRTVIYKKRHHALIGERIGVDIVNTLYDTAEKIVAENYSAGDFENLEMETMRHFSIEMPFSQSDFQAKKVNELVEIMADESFASFKRKMDKMAQIAYPVVKQVYQNQGQQFERILIPITDGKRTYNIPVNLESAYKTEGKQVILDFEKLILLHIIDEQWKENLRELDDLKQSVQNASYEQKDPLLIYKLESFNLFKSMMDTINSRVTSILMRGQIPIREPEQVRRADNQRRTDMSRYRTQKDEYRGQGGNPNDPTRQDTRERQITQPIKSEKSVGRNEPCPCGSGKKYKNCCGA
jgi:preprotein translocase subunit SecA